MFEINQRHGLDPDEAAKLEIATSLAMLSSGAITTFWLIFQEFHDPDVLTGIYQELYSLGKDRDAKICKRQLHY